MICFDDFSYYAWNTNVYNAIWFLIIWELFMYWNDKGYYGYYILQYWYDTDSMNTVIMKSQSKIGNKNLFWYIKESEVLKLSMVAMNAS